MDHDLQLLFRQYQEEPETYRKILELKCERSGRVGSEVANAAIRFGQIFLQAIKKGLSASTAKQRNIARKLSKFSYLTQISELGEIPAKQLSLMVRSLTEHFKLDASLNQLETTTPFLRKYTLPILCCGKHIKRQWTCFRCEPDGTLAGFGGCPECMPKCVSCKKNVHNTGALASSFNEDEDCSIKCGDDGCNNVVCEDCWRVVIHHQQPRPLFSGQTRGGLESSSFDYCTECNEIYCNKHIKLCQKLIDGSESFERNRVKTYCNNVTCSNCAATCSFCDQIVCCSRHYQSVPKCHDCQIVFCENCMSAARPCEMCGQLSCAKHNRKCEVCKTNICVNELAECEDCGNTKLVSDGEKVCQKHVKECSVCGNFRCEQCMGKVGCVFESASSKDKICAKCLKLCAICEEEVCEEHYGKCADCNKFLCLDHFAICEDCKENVCEKCETTHDAKKHEG